MPIIKFSHIYPKLLDEHNDMIETATLVQVSRVYLEQLHPSFIAYDTNNGEYQLPEKGEFLQLLFLKPPELTDGICAANLFTILRRATTGKFRYYADLVGQEFIVELLREEQ